jgi:hypothetical protein
VPQGSEVSTIRKADEMRLLLLLLLLSASDIEFTKTAGYIRKDEKRHEE